jgi:hypothetical protein
MPPQSPNSAKFSINTHSSFLIMPTSKKHSYTKKSEAKPKKEAPKKEKPKKESPKRSTPKSATPKSEREKKFADDIKRMPEKQWGLSPRDLKKES